MSKKSKKILAYLMFVAALCGTPAVSEARGGSGGSGGQVKTEKASVAQRGGNLSESFARYLFKNYGPDALKFLGFGGGGFGVAKMLKAGDFNTWASYLLSLKTADAKEVQRLMNEINAKEKALDKEKKEFESQRTQALNDNTKLNNEKVALELNNKTLNAKVEENEQKIKELEDSKAKLNGEVLNLKNHNDQLLNLNNEDNKKIDALLSGFLPLKMSGELNIFGDNSWKQESYNANGISVEPYSGKGGVQVVIMKYDSNGNALNQQPEWLTLPAGEFFDAIAEQTKGNLINISLKDIDLSYCDIPRLARYSYEVNDGFVSAYFPVKSFQVINNVENVENNENNEDVNVNDNNVDNNNMNNEMNANENDNINGENEDNDN